MGSILKEGTKCSQKAKPVFEDTATFRTKKHFFHFYEQRRELHEQGIVAT